jgi:SAM-dependent methyltransferase
MVRKIKNFVKGIARRVRDTLVDRKLPGWFWTDLSTYNSQIGGSLIGRQAARSDLYPIIGERTSTVEFDPHYVYHVAWAARVLASTKPSNHVDFGSLSHFVTVCSAFMPITHYDFRTPEFKVSGLDTGNADLTTLPMPDGSLTSVSCMHVVEHIGLGRYGDAVDTNGDRKAIRELQRVTAPGGQLLFVVPVGRERVMFNAHRIYGYNTIINAFDEMQIEEFALISLRGKPSLIRNADPSLVEHEEYGCGCFLFTKKANVQ